MIQFTQSVDEVDEYPGGMESMPTFATTPSTQPNTSLTRSRSTNSAARRVSFESPSSIPAASSMTESPQKATNSNTMNRSRTDPVDYRLGAAPFTMNEAVTSMEKVGQSLLQRKSAPQISSTQPTKKSVASRNEKTEHNLFAKNVPAVQCQTPTVAGFQNYLSCGPSLMQAAAAAFLSSDDQYPDPDIPDLEDSSVSSTSGEADAVVRQETSEERRQRLWNITRPGADNSRTAAEVSMEEQGMELIFFQEDEEDWSQFPWSQRMVQTEKVDKDIFLSFTEMGFDETKHQRHQPAVERASLQSKNMDRLPPLPETKTVLSIRDEQQVDPQFPDASVDFVRSSTEPARRDASTGKSQAIQQQRTSSSQQEASTSTSPFARSSPGPSPSRSAVHESVASSNQAAERVVERAVDRPNEIVDRVSNIIKSVPNVFAKMAQSASGPSADSQILLTRSSSQVTWVSHADDFAAMDARPVTEIVIPTTPEGEPKSIVGSSVAEHSTVHAIRNAIFDSIERGSEDDESEHGQSEHKECEDEDLDGAMNMRPNPRPQMNMTSSYAPPLLLSPSSLTFDSRYVPPISNVPVRVPSDGEEHPESTTPHREEGNDMPFPLLNVTDATSFEGTEDDYTPPNPVTPDFTDYGDDISAIDDDLFLEESPPPPDPRYQPQPDTPGERQSLAVPLRSGTMSLSTFDDDESIGLNALASPDRQKVARRLSGDHHRNDSPTAPRVNRASPATPPRKSHNRDYGLQAVIDSPSWDDIRIPTLSPSDDDSDSSSENIDHLLLDKRPPVPVTPVMSTSYEGTSRDTTSYEDASESSILDHKPVRTFSGTGFDLDSVEESEINEATGLFGCACWDIPPLIEQKRSGLFQRREPNEGLLMDRVRSDDGLDSKHDRKGLGRKLVGMARSTSNSFKNLWNRKSQAGF